MTTDSPPEGRPRLLVGSGTRRAAAAAYLAGSILFTVAAVMRAGFACDEGCEEPGAVGGRSWENYRDSWQWDALAALGIAASVLTALALLGRHHLGRWSALIVAAQAAVVVAVVALLGEEQWRGIPTLAALTALIACGAYAVMAERR